MSYKPGSISSFLGGASDGDQGTLSNLFSHESLQKFARVIKPEEIATVKKVAVNTTVEGESDETAVKKKKKPKTRNRKPQGSESADINNTSGSAETSENSSSLKTETEPDGEASRDHRTVFIGNIPTSETVKSIKKLCQEFGEVESVRLRSVPVAGTAVDEAGNQDLVRKVCANSREFSDTKGSFNAYVVFKKVESVSSALTANNRLVGKRHLRIDKANPTLFDPKLSVFIGALPHYTDEEHLRGHFAAVLPNGQDDIVSIRLIRDPETLVGKGIGYLLLKDRDAVLKALSLNESLYKKRKLRVTVCGKRTKRANQRKEGEKEGAADDSNGGSENPRKRPRDERSPEKSLTVEAMNKLNAMKRLKLKNTNTRNKVLIAKKQKKAVPGKKGKRLGGNVKKAMKAEKAAKKIKK